MSKNEFLDRLRASLSGRIAPAQVEDNINYYQDYITSQIRGGRSEAEVMAMLGDPRLIARTIIETSQPADAATQQGNAYRNNGYSGSYANSQNSSNNQGNYQSSAYHTNQKRFRMPGWLMAILAILVFCLIMSVVFSVLSFLAPVLIVIAAVLFLVKLFRDWLN